VRAEAVAHAQQIESGSGPLLLAGSFGDTEFEDFTGGIDEESRAVGELDRNFA
jgi:hypothetical protein